MPTTRSGNPTKGAPKYQNETAFRHNKNSKLTKTILAMPISGLCSHCTDQLNWRKTYRKYKPLTQPKKCVRCQQKSIKDAYHVICKPCAEKDKVCAKCLEAKEIVKSNVPTAEELLVQQLQQKCLLSKMTERQRRSYLRKLAVSLYRFY